MNIVKSEEGFHVEYNGIDIIKHSKDEPFFYVGRGTATYDMYRGNFEIEDDLFEKIPLRNFAIEERDNGYVIKLLNGDEVLVRIRLREEGDYLKVLFSYYSDEINRVWIRISAQK